jgi:hypothetical protein
LERLALYLCLHGLPVASVSVALLLLFWQCLCEVKRRGPEEKLGLLQAFSVCASH